MDEVSEVIVCHVVNVVKDESLPSSCLKIEGVIKDLLMFNVDDSLSFPQETKSILTNTLFTQRASSLSALTFAMWEKASYCMFIDF